MLAQFRVEDSVWLISIPTVPLFMIAVEARSREQKLLTHIIFYGVLVPGSLRLYLVAHINISNALARLDHQWKALSPEDPRFIHHVRVEFLPVLLCQLAPPATNSILTSGVEHKAAERLVVALMCLCDRRLAQPAHEVFLFFIWSGKTFRWLNLWLLGPSWIPGPLAGATTTDWLWQNAFTTVIDVFINLELTTRARPLTSFRLWHRYKEGGENSFGVSTLCRNFCLEQIWMPNNNFETETRHNTTQSLHAPINNTPVPWVVGSAPLAMGRPRPGEALAKSWARAMSEDPSATS